MLLIVQMDQMFHQTIVNQITVHNLINLNLPLRMLLKKIKQRNLRNQRELIINQNKIKLKITLANVIMPVIWLIKQIIQIYLMLQFVFVDQIIPTKLIEVILLIIILTARKNLIINKIELIDLLKNIDMLRDIIN